MSLKNKSKKHLRKLVKFYKKDNDNLMEELTLAYKTVGELHEQLGTPVPPEHPEEYVFHLRSYGDVTKKQLDEYVAQAPTDPTPDNPREAPAPKFPCRVPISPAPPVYTEARKVWEDTLRDGTGIAQYAGGEFTRIPCYTPPFALFSKPTDSKFPDIGVQECEGPITGFQMVDHYLPRVDPSDDGKQETKDDSPVGAHEDVFKDAPDWANYWAQDSTGDAYWYARKPLTSVGEGVWTSVVGTDCSLASSGTLTVDWSQTLVARPKRVPPCSGYEASDEKAMVNKIEESLCETHYIENPGPKYDWDNAPDWANWAATDKTQYSMRGHFFENKPTFQAEWKCPMWCHSGRIAPANIARYGTIQESLEARPEKAGGTD